MRAVDRPNFILIGNYQRRRIFAPFTYKEDSVEDITMEQEFKVYKESIYHMLAIARNKPSVL